MIYRSRIKTHAAPPAGCFWRGNVLWGRVRVSGHLHQFTLDTDDPAVATKRREQEAKRLRTDPDAVDMEALRRKLARVLTDNERKIVLRALLKAGVRY